LKVLITGSSGLIGSAAVEFYDSCGHEVHGIDNNMRKLFFGDKGDTRWNLQRLQEATRRFSHYEIDIRDRETLMELFRAKKFDLVIHCAAQPSHDRAKGFPLLDFEVNALGTLNLLEACRLVNPEAVFIFMSTNKVYGDAPNEISMTEMETRFDYARPEDYEGISEECRIDRATHSLFGASKVAADVMVQEYGRYFGMKTGAFRGGCLTGSYHSGVELHGFLNYVVHVAITGKQYTIFGYKGKQVRDNLHSYDVIQAFEAFRKRGTPGEVYNLGGGRANSISVLEAIGRIEEISGKKVRWTYQEQNRIGDHICYISDLRKVKSHFPEWTVTRTLDSILEEMVKAEMQKGVGLGDTRALPVD
jgi:CDP-paratose 2-epimerase